MTAAVNGGAERITIASVVEGGICVASEDGHRLHDLVAARLKDGRPVILSFERVHRLTTAFLNAAIGQLYNEFPEARIRELIQIEGADGQTLALIKKVTDRAKEFYKQARGAS